MSSLEALLAAPERAVDLHAHTRFSDGELSPDELVARAAAAGVRVLAVTDHDTLAGLAEAQQAADARAITLIPGMEVSARLPLGSDGEGGGAKGVHVLAYFPPGAPPDLSAWAAMRRAARRTRLLAMLERLAALGMPLDPAQVLPADDPEAGNSGHRTPGRPHLARGLLAAGHVGSLQEAFDRWLGEGKPAYVEDQVPAVSEAIGMIHALGGLAVVAHPAVDDLDPDLEAMAAQGLDGVEAYHGSHHAEQAARFHARARALGLLVTGGSDFHGDPPPGEGPGGWRGLGQVDLPSEEWRRFARALCGQREGER